MVHGTYNSRQNGIGTHLLGAICEGAGGVHCAGKELVPYGFVPSGGLTGEHTFVHISASFVQHSVHSDAFARFGEQAIAYAHRVNIDDLDGSVGILAGYFAWLQSRQLLHGARSLPFGARFQYASQQDEGDDHGRGFEIEVRFHASLPPKLGEK